MNNFFCQAPEHLYIHLPFCKTRCCFCDFVALAAHENFILPYNKALCKEIELFAKQVESSDNSDIKTIFLGGGTPSLYPENLIAEIFEKLNRHFNLKNVQEITIETNPSDITDSKLFTWKKLGINRLSLGVQVLDDRALAKLNRFQKTEAVFNAINLAQTYFTNISVDLILGLPGVSLQKWEETLNIVVSFPITHISTYMLTVYEKTPLFFKLQKGDFKIKSDDYLIKCYKHTLNFLKKSKFKQYEISNFAKSGYESIHNKAYWTRKPYYGFGLGASSFDIKNRYTNEKNLEKYIDTITIQKKLPISFHESLSQKQIVLETLMLGLRTSQGVDLHYVLYLLKTFQKNSFLSNVNLAIKNRLLGKKGKKIFLTKTGIFIENEVITNLCSGI